MKRATLLGVGLLVVGVSIAFALLLSFPAMVFGGCTDVGVPEGEERGVAVIGVEDGNFLYTPDGANECSIPLPAVLAPVGFVVIGTGLVLSRRATKNGVGE
ncbi:hypothetical protein [Halorubrum lipolyticum]|uniref:Uncharacterized protein n=1 Tax=Halorubrum lipolyticum DSM 21995 TaxID=1227482 RepID=M0P3N4_9EURY|nr:hypothetical protein [Halorubrum lipolyticum]EMA64701.1 hypothetical protein C469_00555 [Halorubrum lipolyticum DSM 21995]